jgi:Ca2+-binding EF-hand superfamily protein
MTDSASRHRTSALAGIAALAAGLALSLNATAQNKPTFQSLDQDRDGKISLNEAAEHDALFVAFRQLDQDKDGLLTREEFAAYK